MFEVYVYVFLLAWYLAAVEAEGLVPGDGGAGGLVPGGGAGGRFGARRWWRPEGWCPAVMGPEGWCPAVVAS